MKILANDGIIDSARKVIQCKGWMLFDKKVQQNELADFCNSNSIDVIVIRSATKLTAEIIDSFNTVKAIIRGGIGLDNVDLKAAQKKSIKVYNTPEASVNSVAELVIGFCLIAIRHLNVAIKQMPSKGSTSFSELKHELSSGMELNGKTIGIIGAGRIGRKVAEKSLLLGMKPIFYDPYVKKVRLSTGVNHVQLTFLFETTFLDELLASSDIVTLHVNYPKEQGPIITTKELEKIKRGAILINTARGYCVDEFAILKALNKGILGAYACDVYEGEPNPSPALLSHPKVIPTPHIGASTVEAQERIWQEIINILTRIEKAINQ